MKQHYSRISCFIVSCCFLFSNQVTAQFIDKSIVSNDTFTSVHFPNPQVGYIVSNIGTVMKSTDGGDTWAAVAPLTGKLVTSVYFINADTGFVTTFEGTPDSGNIYRTANGGGAWVLVDSDSAAFTAIHFPNPDTGYAVGAKGLRKRTTDGGQNWTDVSNPQIGVSTLYDVYFVSGTLGFATHGSGRLYKTTNAGQNWTLAKDMVLIAGPANNIWFIDANTGFWVLLSKIYKTTDGGNSWTQIYNAGVLLRDIQFVDPNTGFAVGAVGRFIRTLDGGNNWEFFFMDRKLPFRQPLFTAAAFTAYNHGVLVGDSGTIAKFALADISGTVSHQSGPIDKGEVYLFKKRPIDVKMDTMGPLTLDVNGFYQMVDAPVGEYLVLAMPDSVNFPDKLPTYYGDKQFWTDATVLNFFADTDSVDIQVALKPSPPAGNSNIKGVVLEGDYFGGKLMGKGDPIRGVIVSLLTAGNPIQYEMTDDSGRFAFQQVDPGTYSIFADVPGVPVSTNNFTVSSNDSEKVNITVDSFIIIIDTATLSSAQPILNSLGVRVLGVYPNPVTYPYLYVEVESDAKVSIPFSLYLINILGENVQQISQVALKEGDNLIKMDTRSMANGIYLLGFRAGDEVRVIPVTKIVVVR